MSNYTDNGSATLICEDAREILTSTKFYLVSVLEAVAGPVAAVINSFVLYLLWRINVFHPNLLFLLANLSLVLAVYPLAVAFQALSIILTPICSNPMSLKRCSAWDSIKLVPLQNSLLTLLALSVERIYATLRYRTYDNTHAPPPFLSLVLLFVVWSISLGIQILAYLLARKDIMVPVCESGLYRNGAEVTATIIFYITLEVIAFMMTLSVYLCNRLVLKRMVVNRARFCLSARFQVDQNLKLSAALLPSDMLHVACYFPAYACLLLLARRPWPDMATNMFVLHLTYLYRMVYATAHPILLITRNPIMRQAALKTCPGRFVKAMLGFGLRKNGITGAQVNSTNVMNVHFEQLEKAWSMGR